MQTLVPTTKEQLIHYLVHNISLGTYDKKFLTNVYEINKPLTTNQNELLDKIVLRYSRQFAKKNLVATDLINLPWTRPLIMSSPEFTEAHVSIKDDIIYIRTPYKKDYILKLKESRYPIVWNRDNRLWYSEYSVEALKYIVEHTENHFSTVNYSKDIQDIISYLCEYETYKYWDPTLVYIKGRHYLLAANEYLYNAVESLLTDITPYTLTKLVRHGIVIDSSVVDSIEDKKLVEFVIDTQPTLEADNITQMVHYLSRIECDVIIVYNSSYFTKFVTDELTQLLNENNIKLMIIDRYHNYDIEEIKKYNCSVFITSNMKTHNSSVIFTDKILHLVNSEAPQKVKSMYETM